METEHGMTVLVVDDEPMILELLAGILEDEFRVEMVRDGASAVRRMQQGGVDLVLLDVSMPVLDGLEVCRQLKADPRTSRVPVIFVTAQADGEAEAMGLRIGAADYIRKPFLAESVKARVRTHLSLSSQQRHLEFLVRQRTRELEDTELDIIRQLGRASELRDCETGEHVARVSDYAYLIALSAGLAEEQAALIRTVAPLHDVGKIGVPDLILRKRGPLTPEEWGIVHTHCELGWRIIGEHEREPLKTAALCAYCHHEHWDGHGYPRGLKGEEIPLVARILAVADVFDALTCERPYKRAWPFEAAVAEVKRCRGGHFDPAIVDAFLAALPEIARVRTESSLAERRLTTAGGYRESSSAQALAVPA